MSEKEKSTAPWIKSYPTKHSMEKASTNADGRSPPQSEGLDHMDRAEAEEKSTSMGKEKAGKKSAASTPA